jgi:hypothetical protein
MGREANCVCEWNATSAQIKALLEPPELILRGGLRRRIQFAEIERITVDGPKLRFAVGGDKVCLILGEATASKWAQALSTPPSTLAKKLGITPASKVRIIGTIEDEALRLALADAHKVTRGNADLILARVNAPAELITAFAKTADLLANGTPIWIVYRKGPGHAINESGVRAAGLAAGVVDVKVASVSAQLTALKFVKLKLRRKNVLPAPLAFPSTSDHTMGQSKRPSQKGEPSRPREKILPYRRTPQSPPDPKSNMSHKSPIAGPFVGTYGFDSVVRGLGRLSRLRRVIGDRFQFRSMNLRIETWSV